MYFCVRYRFSVLLTFLAVLASLAVDHPNFAVFRVRTVRRLNISRSRSSPFATVAV